MHIPGMGWGRGNLFAGMRVAHTSAQGVDGIVLWVPVPCMDRQGPAVLGRLRLCRIMCELRARPDHRVGLGGWHDPPISHRHM